MISTTYDPSTWIPYLELITPFATAIAWPLAAVFIAYKFKGDIGSLFSRISSLGPKGVAFGKQQSQSDLVISSEADSQKLKELAGRERTAVMRRVEEEIKTTFSEVADSERSDALYYALAQSRLDTGFWRIYHYIFGSQISLLKALRSSALGLSLSDIEPFISVARQNIPSLTAENYLQFITDSHLIVSDSEGKFQITDVGEDFLLFIYRYKLPENRLN